MPTLAGACVQEHGSTAGRTLTVVGAAIGAASIVAAIDGETGRYAVHPPQTAFRIAVRLDAPGRLAIQGACQRAVRARK